MKCRVRTLASASVLFSAVRCSSVQTPMDVSRLGQVPAVSG